MRIQLGHLPEDGRDHGREQGQADDAPAAAGSDYPKPIEVTFSFRTKGPGEYVWNCEFPCGDGTYAKFGGPMSTRGWMSGTLTVT